MTFESRLLDALRETPAEGQTRRRELGASLIGKKRELVLFGAGGLGRRTQRTLRDLDYAIPAFADNDPGKWGTLLDGTPVVSPEEAIARYGQRCTFLVTIWRAEGNHDYLDTRRGLMAMGAAQVAHFGHLAWMHPDAFLPYYSMDRPELMLAASTDMVRALETLEEDHSREVFARHGLWRLDLDFSAVAHPDPEAIYFDPSLVPPCPSEVFIDGGAYDGDTVATALERWGNHLKAVHAFEPDPDTVERFKKRFELAKASCPIHVYTTALSDRAGILRFAAEGRLSSASTPQGELLVPCGRLDDQLPGVSPTFLKLDIEGAELEALEGASEILARHRPRLAICAYHRQSHLWELPLCVQKHRHDSRLRFRSHGTEGWELVLYVMD